MLSDEDWGETIKNCYLVISSWKGFKNPSWNNFPFITILAACPELMAKAFQSVKRALKIVYEVKWKEHVSEYFSWVFHSSHQILFSSFHPSYFSKNLSILSTLFSSPGLLVFGIFQVKIKENLNLYNLYIL